MIFFHLLLMKYIYIYIYMPIPYCTIFLDFWVKKNYYFESFIYYKWCRLLRIIGKVDGLLYPENDTHNVVSLLYRKPYRRHELSQYSDLVYISTLPSKNIHELMAIWFSCYGINLKYHREVISLNRSLILS